MIPNQVELLAEERRKEIVRQMRQRQLIAWAEQASGPARPFSEYVHTLGAQLIRWGMALIAPGTFLKQEQAAVRGRGTPC